MKNFFFRNPWIRTFFPLSLMTIASVTANTLVVEIAKGTIIDWVAIPKKTSFYILLATTVITAIYQVLLFKSDNLMLKDFLTAKQYWAALRSKALEESANTVKRLIQEGKIDELERATTTFKKLFGEGA